MCHLTRVTCHMSCVTFFGGGRTKWWNSSVEGQLSTGPTPSSSPLYPSVFLILGAFLGNRVVHYRWQKSLSSMFPFWTWCSPSLPPSPSIHPSIFPRDSSCLRKPSREDGDHSRTTSWPLQDHSRTTTWPWDDRHRQTSHIAAINFSLPCFTDIEPNVSRL